MPLLVVGLPRSGSTLLQQMLAAHPAILFGDQYTALAEAVNHVVSSRTAAKSAESDQAFDQLRVLQDPHARADILKRYRRSLPRQTAAPEVGRWGSMLSALFGLNMASRSPHGSGGYVIDRQLSNVWWLGALPACAKAIIVQRDDMDVGYGSFRTYFSQSGHEFTYDQRELGWRIILTRHIMEHWLHVLPSSQVMAVRYEELVAEPQSTLERVFDFLDLPMADASTRPHEYNRTVLTTEAAVQARSPVDGKGRIGAWNRYATALEPLMHGIAEAKTWVRSMYDNASALEEPEPSADG